VNGSGPAQGSSEQQAAELERLRRTNAELQRKLVDTERELEQLRKKFEDLQKILEEALRSGKRQAGPFRRKTRKENPKKPGRKAGHAGAHREPPEICEQTKRGPELCQCPHCQGPVTNRSWLENYETDLPAPRVVRTRFVFQGGWCEHCQRRVYARHADQTSIATGAAASHVGPRAVALLSSMKFWLGTPFRKAASFVQQVFGLRITAGGVVQGSQRLALRSTPTHTALVQTLHQDSPVHSDETGWLVGSTNAWLWVLCSERVTVYLVHEDRCADVVPELLGADFGGWFVRDGFASYDKQLPGFAQLRCLLHLKHNVQELADKQIRGAVKSPRYFLDWLNRVFTLKRQVPLLDATGYQEHAADLVRDFDWFVGRNYCDARNAAMAKRLAEQRGQILPIVQIPELPATNNLAERQTRFGVVVRKISAGNRTWRGAQTFGVLASIGATCIQQAVSFFQVLLDIQLAPSGSPVRFWATPPVDQPRPPATARVLPPAVPEPPPDPGVPATSTLVVPEPPALVVPEPPALVVPEPPTLVVTATPGAVTTLPPASIAAPRVDLLPSREMSLVVPVMSPSPPITRTRYRAFPGWFGSTVAGRPRALSPAG
jgi:transposase